MAKRVITKYIDDLAVTTVKIADQNVTNAKLADTSIMGVKLTENAKHTVLQVKMAALRDGLLGITANVGDTHKLVTGEVLAAATTLDPIGVGQSVSELNQLGIFVGNVSGASDSGKVLLRMHSTDNGLADNLNDEVYGVLTESSGAYTLNFYNALGTHHTIAENVILDAFFVEVYTLDSFHVDQLLYPAIGGVIDATSYDTLTGKLDVERSARIAADNALQNEVDLVEGGIGDFMDGDGAILGFGPSKPAGDSRYMDNALTITQALYDLDFSLYTEASARSAADNVEASARAASDSTLQANIDTEASARIAADRTLQAEIDEFSGTFVGQFVADGDIAKGDILYITPAGKAKKARANDVATCTCLAGVAKEDIADLSTGNVYLMGKVVVHSDADDLELGGRAYVSAATPGIATKTAPNAAGDVVHLVGAVFGIVDSHSWKVNLEPHLEYIVE